MNRREFIKLFAVAVSGPGAVAMLPSPAVATHTAEDLIDLVRRKTAEARDGLARQIEEAAFRQPASITFQGVRCYYNETFDFGKCTFTIGPEDAA